MDEQKLLEALLELASRGDLEVRVLSQSAGAADYAPTSSAACRVGDRIWVVLAPDDPILYQAEILAQALGRYRSDVLESSFIAPGVREFLDRMRHSGSDFVDPPER
jgi:uncharacterized protein with GYD domain